MKVLIGAKETNAIAFYEDTIVASVPPDISNDDLKDGNLEVKVIAGGVESNAKSILIKPEIKGIHPPRARGGVITVSGINFGALQKENRISFSSKGTPTQIEFDAEILSWNDVEIKAIIPDDKNPTTEDITFAVKVISGKFSSNEKEFTYQGTRKKEQKP